MTRQPVSRRDDEIAIRHISQVLPRVLANYVSRNELSDTSPRQSVQLNLFEDLMSSIGSQHRGTVAG